MGGGGGGGTGKPAGAGQRGVDGDGGEAGGAGGGSLCCLSRQRLRHILEQLLHMERHQKFSYLSMDSLDVQAKHNTGYTSCSETN